MENKMELVIPSFHSITRSYSEKVNLANHIPGHEYESMDFFSSHNEQVPIDAPEEERTALSEKLFELAKSDVELAKMNAVNALKQEAGIAIEPTGKEYEQIQDFIVGYDSAVSAEDAKKVSEAIAEKKSELNEVQLDYLRTIGNKANARTLPTKDIKIISNG